MKPHHRDVFIYRLATVGRSICRTALALLYLSATVSAAGVRVTDGLGRTMRVPEDPQRIISFAPSITEIVFALHRQARLVAVTEFSNYPPGARALPRIGSYVRLDLERIVALRPDLCLATKDGNPREVVARLESLGIPVFAVDPRDLATVSQAVGEIGGLLGAEVRARKLTSEIERRVAEVRKRVATTTVRPRLFFQIGISPIVSTGSETFLHELIETAGARNLAAGPVSYPRFNEEEVIRLQPEIIVITSMARGGQFQAAKERWQRWESIPAVADDRVHLVDSDIFDRPSPRLIEALETLARLIHPGLFP